MLSRHFSGKQATACSTWAAMVIVGAVIAAMMLAPNRALPAHAAKMNWLIVCVVAHFAPIALAQRAD